MHIRNFGTKRHVIVVSICVLSIGLVAGFFLWNAIRQGTKQAQFKQIGGGVPTHTSSPLFSEDYNDFSEWLKNDISRWKQPWDVEVATKLMSVLDARYTQEQVENVAMRPGATLRDQEPVLYFGDVMGIAAERLRRNEPIEPEARRILVIAMTDALDDPYHRIRMNAISSVCYARLVKDPGIRAKIEAMFNDPEEYVALGAREGLAHFDNIERLRAEGKWNEPWIKD